MSNWKLWVPLGLFVFLFALFAGGLLVPKDNVITSKMIGKPLPEFELPQAVEDRPALSKADFTAGEPRLLNIFASWCVPCIAEAPHLQTLANAGANIQGVAIRDTPQDVARFLARNGNPYSRIGADDVSALQLEIGSSGVPETFVVNGKGLITYQHIGDIRESDIPVILEQLEAAR